MMGGTSAHHSSAPQGSASMGGDMNMLMDRLRKGTLAPESMSHNASALAVEAAGRESIKTLGPYRHETPPLRQEISRYQDEIVKMEDEIHELYLQLDREKSKKLELADHLTSAMETVDQLVNRNDEVNGTLRSTTAKLDEMHIALHVHEMEIERRQKEAHFSQRALDVKDRALDTMASKMVNAQGRIYDLTTDLEHKAENLGKLQATLHTQEEQAQARETSLLETISVLETQAREKELVHNQKARELNADRDTLNQKVIALQKKHDNDLAQAKQLASGFQEALAASVQSNETLKESKNPSEKRLSTKEVDVRRSEAKLKDMTTAEEPANTKAAPTTQQLTVFDLQNPIKGHEAVVFCVDCSLSMRTDNAMLKADNTMDKLVAAIRRRNPRALAAVLAHNNNRGVITLQELSNKAMKPDRILLSVFPSGSEQWVKVLESAWSMLSNLRKDNPRSSGRIICIGDGGRDWPSTIPRYHQRDAICTRLKQIGIPVHIVTLGRSCLPLEWISILTEGKIFVSTDPATFEAVELIGE